MEYPIIETVDKFYKDLKRDKNHRYMSWVHCFNSFQQTKQTNNEEYIDYLSLQLAFYLASWGMIRGSTGLLWKDYKIHQNTVKIILKQEYDEIRYSSDKEIGNKQIELIINAKDEITKYYEKVEYIKPTKNGEPESDKLPTITPTDTLISKILLGTLGCLPAYDRYLLDGLRVKEIKQPLIKGSYINQKSLTNLLNFVSINNNISAFQEVQHTINKIQNGFYYPIMKIVDMYLWEVGRQIEKTKINNGI